MYSYDGPEPKTHTRGALEIAMQARIQERKQALMASELKAELAAEDQDRKSQSRGLIASLLAGLKLF